MLLASSHEWKIPSSSFAVGMDEPLPAPRSEISLFERTGLKDLHGPLLKSHASSFATRARVRDTETPFTVALSTVECHPANQKLLF